MVMTLIWGATFVIVKRALADVSTLLFLTIRFGTAAFVLALIFRTHFRKDFRAGTHWNEPARRCAGWILPVQRLRAPNAGAALHHCFESGLSHWLHHSHGGRAQQHRLPQSAAFIEVLGVATAFLGMALMTIPAAGSRSAGAIFWWRDAPSHLRFTS